MNARPQDPVASDQLSVISNRSSVVRYQQSAISGQPSFVVCRSAFRRLFRNHGDRHFPALGTRHSSLGFTLIELLVVIAIISILAALLLPGLKRARDSAKKIACMSNMRQIALAMRMYGNDYDDYLPAGRYVNGDQYVDLGWDATLILTGYLRGTGAAPTEYTKCPVFICPSDKVTRLWGYGVRSYSANRGHWSYLCGWAGPNDKTCRFGRIAKPSDFILLIEKMDEYNFMGYRVNSGLDYGGALSSHAPAGDTYAGNYAFADGSVRWLTRVQAEDANKWSRSGVWEDLSGEW